MKISRVFKTKKCEKHCSISIALCSNSNMLIMLVTFSPVNKLLFTELFFLCKIIPLLSIYWNISVFLGVQWIKSLFLCSQVCHLKITVEYHLLCCWWLVDQVLKDLCHILAVWAATFHFLYALDLTLHGETLTIKYQVIRPFS